MSSNSIAARSPKANSPALAVVAVLVVVTGGGGHEEEEVTRLSQMGKKHTS